jgi:hypothetical protein
MNTSLREFRAQTMRASLSVLAGLALIGTIAATPAPARADIVYTWHEDDALAFNGSMAVKQSAQAAGMITLSDFTAFAFNTPYGSFSLSDFVPSEFVYDLPISPVDAGFTAPPPGPQRFGAADNSIPVALVFTVDTNWSVPSGEASFVGHNDADTIVGAGHWSISGANAVPEPATLTLALVGLASVGAWWHYRTHLSRGKRSE